MVVAQNGKRLQFIPFSESIEKLWFKKKKKFSVARAVSNILHCFMQIGGRSSLMHGLPSVLP